ncbi:hypothetical protein PG989_015678 [Apiospora arundinis]
MADRLVVVISGAGRGLGNCLAKGYLARSNCTVVGTVRDDASPGVAELRSLSVSAGPETKLMIVKVESASDNDAKNAVEQMQAAGIDHVDILIANAGVSPPVDPLEKVSFTALESTIRVNALGPLSLYQACHPLLSKSKDAKFVTISSAAGSLSAMEGNGAWVAPSYSISKAALNWITLSAHCGNNWLTAFAVNPGLVDSDMGNRTAAFLGLERAPLTMAYSANKIMKLIEGASRKYESGKFLNVSPLEGKGMEKEGQLCTELPW